MPVFASDRSSDPRVKTFAEPAKKPAPVRTGADRLLVAATAAEAAEHVLTEAKNRYHRAPTHDNRTRLIEAIASALEKEVTFDEMWEVVSREWFGEVPSV